MQQITRSFSLAFNNFPIVQCIILRYFTVFTLITAILNPYIHSPVAMPVNNHIIKINNNKSNKLTTEFSRLFDQNTIENKNNILKKHSEEKNENTKGMHEYIISYGDTLNKILIQQGINKVDIANLVKINPLLNYLKIGQVISWDITNEGNLRYLRLDVSQKEKRTYFRTHIGFKEIITNISKKCIDIVLTGKINGSFIESARSSGLINTDINEIIKVMQWQLDFRKLRNGDQFSVLISRESFGRKDQKNRLLGVRIYTQYKNYYAFRADDGKFYNYDAVRIDKGFARFPTIKEFRVSSKFNLHRLNPITGRIAPHLGVDFAVPVGTLILSVGDGEVIISKNSNIAGNYIVIRHDHQYMTCYMHLKKILVKPGQKVRRGDYIALSGNTGRSTGPHVHFEVWVNRKAVNPLTAKLPRSDWLIGKELSNYQILVKHYLSKLKFS